MTKLAHLPQRGVIAVTGADRVSFLNGLVSNEVSNGGSGRAVWAALLTPQGKYLADFFIFATGDALLLDVPVADIPVLLPKLRRFKLRAAVELADVSDPIRRLCRLGWPAAGRRRRRRPTRACPRPDTAC